MPDPQLCRCNPFRGRFVGRGLAPSAAARGLAALQAPANGECRGGIHPSRGASGTPPPTGGTRRRFCCRKCVLTLKSGFPRGGSCQRPRPLTDEGRACHYCVFTACGGKLSPRPALRGHLLPQGEKAKRNSPPPILLHDLPFHKRFLDSAALYRCLVALA